MNWYDYLIVLLPLAFVLYMGFYSRRYVRGVADFLAAGRICGRYVICIGDVANALAIITLASYVETHYKTGFAVTFWSRLIAPLTIILSLTGYCTYRFRETRALSLGQFLEMRYNRPLRIFASGLRSIAEMLANMIMPAIGARFFIYFLDLPSKIHIGPIVIQTYMILLVIILIMAISLICFGGTLSLVITDAIQGLCCYPLLTLFILFILFKFSWSREIVPTMMDRVSGESFLNPTDIKNLRDFNLFSLVMLPIVTSFLHRASWIGAGTSSAARTAHEQKMAHILGSWRNLLGTTFYVLIGVSIITLLNNYDFRGDAKIVRTRISTRVANEVLEKESPELRQQVIAKVEALPANEHRPSTPTAIRNENGRITGWDNPNGLSQKKNLDTPYLDTVHQTMLEGMNPQHVPLTQQIEAAKAAKDDKLVSDLQAKLKDSDGDANAKFQQFRALYHQLMLPTSMRKMLPGGLLGLFALLMVLAMLSTDDTRIYSATLTIAQDCVLPFKKGGFTPKQHMWMIRIVAISIGVFFFCGSFFMAQMDYISLYVSMVCSFWMGGCGPVMIFGLYSRFGTTAGAFTSLIAGMLLSGFTAFLNRRWADVVFPWLARHKWDEAVGHFLVRASRPFNPIIKWEMNPTKCPINSYEFYFMVMLICTALYIVVSKLTCKEPFNMERMLHRGKYAVDGETKQPEKFSFHNLWKKFIGITPEYTRGDKCIAWGMFCYSFVYSFLGLFVTTAIWNKISPWPLKWWGNYYLIDLLIVPCVGAFITMFWFGIGGVRDLRQLFIDLKKRKVNPLDNGQVDGNVSLADKAQFAQVEGEKPKDK